MKECGIIDTRVIKVYKCGGLNCGMEWTQRPKVEYHDDRKTIKKITLVDPKNCTRCKRKEWAESPIAKPIRKKN